KQFVLHQYLMILPYLTCRPMYERRKILMVRLKFGAAILYFISILVYAFNS
uniref:Uncharacterized protein n=1 Tax=Oryza brachyantha TaxID=4533 RepID=J3MA49_ORYBR